MSSYADLYVNEKAVFTYRNEVDPELLLLFSADELLQPWRTEPEIDAERQTYLAERRSIMPDIKQGIYQLKYIKLNRADVEWLLGTHEQELTIAKPGTMWYIP